MIKKFFKIAQPNSLDSSNQAYTTPIFNKILEVVNLIHDTNFGKAFAGNCIAACDIIQNTLYNVRIKSTITEVNLSILKHNSDGSIEYGFVGFDEVAYEGHIDTHAVIITETDPPLLIDMSLLHVLPSDKQVVVHQLKEEIEPNLLLKTQIENISLSYFIKKVPKYLPIHQKTVIQRMYYEKEKLEKISMLRLVSYLAVALGGINLILNLTILTIKILNNN